MRYKIKDNFFLQRKNTTEKDELVFVKQYKIEETSCVYETFMIINYTINYTFN